MTEVSGQQPKKSRMPTLLIIAIAAGVLGVLGICMVGVLATLLMPALMKAKTKANEAKCANNLRQIALAAIQHADDTRYFPYDASDPTGRKAIESLYPKYFDNKEVTSCPCCDEGDFSYEGFPVEKLSINAPPNRPIVWDAKPHPDGTRNVAFVDGHTVRVGEEQFQQLLEAAKKPVATSGAR